MRSVTDKAIEGVTRVVFKTSNGSLFAACHPVVGATTAVVMLGGANGGLGGPSGIYPELAGELSQHGIASLRLDYRFPNHLDKCVIDTMFGVRFLRKKGIERMGIVGWSFGGAVALNAAAVSDNIVAIATISTQCFGTEAARHINNKPMLIIHGSEDTTVPAACSEYLYNIASGQKDIRVYEGANHRLDQAHDKMLSDLEEFFVKHLGSE